ncbi:MAG: phosphoribosylformylglycinamidine cyclo-ligase [Armatimonadetes bacterium]|nr:phosphoribosylformylglycinamidine cyclo-ligase [Armatimonadota bacterium]
MDDISTYKDAGVNIDAGNEAVLRMKEYIRGTFTSNVLADVGAFGGMFRLDLAGISEPILVSSIDGVGTKLKIAFSMNKHDTIGIDLVNHCVNDILVQGARPLFFLDYFGTGQLLPSVVVDVVKGLSEACKAHDCVLLGGETAEMPGMYLAGEYDLAGCIVGVVDREKIVDGSKALPGDVLIGLASNGLHTNGFSLVRNIFLEKAKLRVDQFVPGLDMTLGEELLRPHRSYCRSVQAILGEFDVHGMAHITGGGFYDNIPRALPADCQAVVERRTFTPPTIFQLIQELGNVSDREMYRAFNMGIGFVLIVPKEDESAVLTRLAEMGETALYIGEVRKGSREVQIV